MKIWITGAEGLVGRALALLCTRRRVSYLATGRLEADITDLEQLKRYAALHQPTHLVNCAAYTDVEGAESAPKKAFSVNALGAENVAAVARGFGMRLLHLSTDYVFGAGEKTSPYCETDSCLPKGIYASSKWEGELRALDEFPSMTVLRTSWVFGSRGKNFISGLLGRLCSQEEVRALTDQKGRATYCEDLAEAVLKLICHSGIFHFANAGELTRYQIALDMYEVARKRGVEMACKQIVPVSGHAFPCLAPRPSYSVLCTKKAAGVLGEQPKSWLVALEEYLENAIVK